MVEYPGATEFFGILLKERPGYLITRNIKEVAEIFREQYNFRQTIAEAANKKILGMFFPFSRQYKNYLVIGDSKEDQDFVDTLNEYAQTTEWLNSVTSIYVAESSNERHLNENFTINIGRNYTGLVEILEGR